MSNKSFNLEHPLFQIATNMSKKLRFNIYPRSNMNMFTLREGITDFVLNKEDEDEEDEED